MTSRNQALPRLEGKTSVTSIRSKGRDKEDDYPKEEKDKAWGMTVEELRDRL